jgi:cellulose synthase/poly-beta-1,6-N-acetylglucosamine synthase-like glycosyltransferase
MSNRGLVSIIVPCRDEEQFLAACLDSIIANDYPKDKLEVFVVDGESRDASVAIAESYARRYPFIRVLQNPGRTAPSGLNRGLRCAEGDIVMRMDVHVSYPPHYISTLVDWLDRSGAGNVGGVCITRPANDSAIARAIAIALAHPFGVGNSYFRIGTSEPRWVDTVPFGCYRSEVFRQVGLFDEELVRNQDDEFNLRLIKHGLGILLVPDVVSYYYARESLSKLWRMYFQYGYFKPLVARKIGGVLTVRQLIPAAFASSLIVTGLPAAWFFPAAIASGLIILAYALAIIACAARVVPRHGCKPALALAVVFPVLHLSYGFGYLKGIMDFLVFRNKRPTNTIKVPLSR